MSDCVVTTRRDAQQRSRGRCSRNKQGKPEHQVKCCLQPRKKGQKKAGNRTVSERAFYRRQGGMEKRILKALWRGLPLTWRKQTKHKKAELSISILKEISNLQRKVATQKSLLIWWCQPVEKIYTVSMCCLERLMGQMESPCSRKVVKLVFFRKPDAAPTKGIKSYRLRALTSVISKWYASCILLRLERKEEPENLRNLHLGGVYRMSCQHLQVMATNLLQKNTGNCKRTRIQKWKIVQW